MFTLLHFNLLLIKIRYLLSIELKITMTKKWESKMAEEPPYWTRLELLRSRTLKELRAGRGHTQRFLADSLGVKVPRISRIEHLGDEQRISSIRKYVEELGGQLKLVVEFDDAPPTEILGILDSEKETGRKDKKKGNSR